MPRTRWHVCYGKITNLTLRSEVTNNGTRHIVWRWSTYMPNMKSLSWTTKKLQPGRDLLRTQGPVCWGQSSRSKVTSNGTWHIIWRWSTYMPNMKSLSWMTKKLEPAHDLLRMQGPIWPWGQNSRSKVTNNGMWHRLEVVYLHAKYEKPVLNDNKVTARTWFVMDAWTSLTLRSKFKVKGHQQWYATYYLEVVYLHAKYAKPVLNDK
jgi:hypothetical protein